MTVTIEELLAQARARLARVGPQEAAEILARGGLVIDIRPRALRRAAGEIPGAIAVERNVLEWRLDPASEHRLPEVTGYDIAVVLVCDEGYASSLAAATLQELGLRHATDLAGGFRAWAAAGLPIRRD